MPSPGSGTANSVVAPTAPDEAQDADVADPGEVEATKQYQRETGTGKYGAQQADSFNADEDSGDSSSSSSSDDPQQQQEKSWIEIKLFDEDNRPVVGEQFEITLPNNQVAGGATDENGVGRVEGFDPGQCKITFPQLDKTIWQDR